MDSRNRIKLNVEVLEDRLTPSLTIMTDTFGNLNISGAPDPDPANPDATQAIVVNEGPQSFYTISEGTPPVPVGGPNAIFFAPNGVCVNFSQSTLDDSVTVNLNGFTMNGNLSVNTGGGNDTVNIAGGAGGSIGGSVTLTNVQTVGADLNPGDNLRIGGNFTTNAMPENLPFGFQIATTSVGGNLGITEGNGNASVLFFAGNTVGHNLTIGLGNGSFNNTLLNVNVGGSVSYFGGSGEDMVTLLGTVGRSVTVNLGVDQGPLAVIPNRFTELAGTTIGGNLTVLGGIGGNAVTVSGLVGGSAYFNLNSAGTMGSSLTFDGFINGPITYIGGAGPDTILFQGTTHNATANFQLGAGANSFTLGFNAMTPYNPNLALLFIDFGPGADTFNNFAGFSQPRLILRNLK